MPDRDGPPAPDLAEAMEKVEVAAREVDALFGGKPFAWTLDGLPLTPTADQALLILHDCLKDVTAARAALKETDA